MHSSRKLVLILLLALLPLSGCDRIHQLLNANDTIKKQGQQIASLQSQVSSLTQELKQIKKEQGQLEITNFVNGLKGTAYLTPGQSGYSLIHTDLGTFTVQLSNIRPYANGSKISLRFGNLLAASINGLTFRIKWGQVNDKGDPEYTSSQEKKFTERNGVRSCLLPLRRCD